MKLCSLLFLVALGTIPCSAQSWRPDDRLLHAFRQVESSGGRYLYGDGGLSLGDFQLSEAAWVDVNAWRKARRLPTYSYRRHVMHPGLNRQYASDYLSIIHAHLTRKLKRAPNPGELYAAYNMGMSGFATCNYQLARVNRVTARKCQLIRRLMQSDASMHASIASAVRPMN